MPYDPKKFDINITLRDLQRKSEEPMRDQMIDYYHQNGRSNPTLKEYISNGTSNE